MSVGFEKCSATKHRTRRCHPIPGAPEVVAVAEHETARDLVERLQRGLGEVRRPQRVGPVERRGHAGVDRFECAEQVARVDVLGAEDLTVLQVVEDEVLAERPVAAVATQGGLPHVTVGVDHAGHEDAGARVDLDRPLRDGEVLAHRGDRVVRDQDVAAEDHAGGVDRDHDAVAEHDRSARNEVLGVRAGVGHLPSSSLRLTPSDSTTRVGVAPGADPKRSSLPRCSGRRRRLPAPLAVRSGGEQGRLQRRPNGVGRPALACRFALECKAPHGHRQPRREERFDSASRPGRRPTARPGGAQKSAMTTSFSVWTSRTP